MEMEEVGEKHSFPPNMISSDDVALELLIQFAIHVYPKLHLVASDAEVACQEGSCPREVAIIQ